MEAAALRLSGSTPTTEEHEARSVAQSICLSIGAEAQNVNNDELSTPRLVAAAVDGRHQCTSRGAEGGAGVRLRAKAGHPRHRALD